MATPGPRANKKTRSRFSLSLAKGTSLFSFKTAPGPSSGTTQLRATASQSDASETSSSRDHLYRARTLSPPVSAIIHATDSSPFSVNSSASHPSPHRSSTPLRTRSQRAHSKRDVTGSPSSSAFDLSSIAFDRKDIPVALGHSSTDITMSSQSTMQARNSAIGHKDEDDKNDGHLLAAIEQQLKRRTGLRKVPVTTRTPVCLVSFSEGVATGTTREEPAAPTSYAAPRLSPNSKPAASPEVDHAVASTITTALIPIDAASHPAILRPLSASQCTLNAIRSSRTAASGDFLSPNSAPPSLSPESMSIRSSYSAQSAQLVTVSASSRKMVSDRQEREQGQGHGYDYDKVVQSSPWTTAGVGRTMPRSNTIGELGEVLRRVKSSSTSVRRPPVTSFGLDTTSRSPLPRTDVIRPCTDNTVGLAESATMSRCNVDPRTSSTSGSTATFTRNASEKSVFALGIPSSCGARCTSPAVWPSESEFGTKTSRSANVARRLAQSHPSSQAWAVPQLPWTRNDAASTRTSSSTSFGQNMCMVGPGRESATWQGHINHAPLCGSSPSRSSDIVGSERKRHEEELGRIVATHARETSVLLSALADAQGRMGGVYRHEYDALRAECESLRTLNESANVERDKVVRAQKILADEYEGLRFAHEASSQAHAKLDGMHQTLYDQHQTLIASHQGLRIQLHAMQAARQKHESQAEADLDALSEAYDALSSSHAQLDASHTALTAEFKDLAVVYERLEQEHAELREAHEGLVRGYSALVKVHERASAGDEVGRMRQDLEDAVTAARVLREENAELRVRAREAGSRARLEESGEEADVSCDEDIVERAAAIGCEYSSVSSGLGSKSRSEPGRRTTLAANRNELYGPGLGVCGTRRSTKQLRLVSGATTVRMGSGSERSADFCDRDSTRTYHSADASIGRDALDPSQARSVALQAHDPPRSDLPTNLDFAMDSEAEDRFGPHNGTFGGNCQQYLHSSRASEDIHARQLSSQVFGLLQPSEDPSFAIPTEADGMSLLVMQSAQLYETSDGGAGTETDSETGVMLSFGAGSAR